MANSKVSESSIAESLKIILIKKKLNISKLAELMGVSNTTMYSKFNRGNFSVKDLDEISKALNLSYEVTFTINDEEQNALK